jgi:hypothetical protein
MRHLSYCPVVDDPNNSSPLIFNGLHSVVAQKKEAFMSTGGVKASPMGKLPTHFEVLHVFTDGQKNMPLFTQTSATLLPIRDELPLPRLKAAVACLACVRCALVADIKATGPTAARNSHTCS